MEMNHPLRQGPSLIESSDDDDSDDEPSRAELRSKSSPEACRKNAEAKLQALHSTLEKDDKCTLETATCETSSALLTDGPLLGSDAPTTLFDEPIASEPLGTSPLCFDDPLGAGSPLIFDAPTTLLENDPELSAAMMHVP